MCFCLSLPPPFPLPPLLFPSLQSAPVTMQVGEGQQVQIVQAAAQGQAQTAQPAGQTMQVMQQIITNTGEIQQIPVSGSGGGGRCGGPVESFEWIRMWDPVDSCEWMSGDPVDEYEPIGRGDPRRFL